jgi:hypothetical protein
VFYPRKAATSPKKEQGTKSVCWKGYVSQSIKDHKFDHRPFHLELQASDSPLFEENKTSSKEVTSKTFLSKAQNGVAGYNALLKKNPALLGGIFEVLK